MNAPHRMSPEGSAFGETPTARQRVTAWETRLADVFATFAQRAFCFGRNDCTHFILAAEQALYGQTYLAPFVPQVRTAEALCAMRARDDIEAKIRWSFAAAGYRQILPQTATAGDLVLLTFWELPFPYAFGAVDGDGMRVVLLGEQGLRLRSLADLCIHYVFAR